MAVNADEPDGVLNTAHGPAHRRRTRRRYQWILDLVLIESSGRLTNRVSTVPGACSGATTPHVGREGLADLRPPRAGNAYGLPCSPGGGRRQRQECWATRCCASSRQASTATRGSGSGSYRRSPSSLLASREHGAVPRSCGCGGANRARCHPVLLQVLRLVGMVLRIGGRGGSFAISPWRTTAVEADGRPRAGVYLEITRGSNEKYRITIIDRDPIQGLICTFGGWICKYLGPATWKPARSGAPHHR